MSSLKDVFKSFNLSDDNEIFRGYSTMTELYNSLKFIIMLFFIQKILRFYVGVAFLKSASIYVHAKIANKTCQIPVARKKKRIL